MIAENYYYSWFFLVLFFFGIMGVFLGIAILRQKKAPGGIHLSIWTLASSLWSIAYAFEFAAIEITSKLFWAKLAYLGIAVCPISFFFFSMAFSSKVIFQRNKIIFALYSIAALNIVSVATNDLHHLHWTSISVFQNSAHIDYSHGILFWLFYGIAYLFLFFGLANLYLLFYKFPERFRSRVGIFIVGTLIPVVANLIYVFDINPVQGLDWTPLAFVISGALLSLNVFGLKVFDLIPFARNKLFEVMPDAVLVLDKDGKVVDFNSSLVHFSKLDENVLVGKTWLNLFPEWERYYNSSSNEKIRHFDIVVKNEGIHYYAVQSISLFDKQNGFCGNLINIRDVSTQKIAIERLSVEMKEKERLIDELDAFSHTVAHDLKICWDRL